MILFLCKRVCSGFFGSNYNQKLLVRDSSDTAIHALIAVLDAQTPGKDYRMVLSSRQGRSNSKGLLKIIYFTYLLEQYAYIYDARKIHIDQGTKYNLWLCSQKL